MRVHINQHACAHRNSLDVCVGEKRVSRLYAGAAYFYCSVLLQWVAALLGRRRLLLLVHAVDDVPAHTHKHTHTHTKWISLWRLVCGAVYVEACPALLQSVTGSLVLLQCVLQSAATVLQFCASAVWQVSTCSAFWWHFCGVLQGSAVRVQCFATVLRFCASAIYQNLFCFLIARRLSCCSLVQCVLLQCVASVLQLCASAVCHYLFCFLMARRLSCPDARTSLVLTEKMRVKIENRRTCACRKQTYICTYTHNM